MFNTNGANDIVCNWVNNLIETGSSGETLVTILNRVVLAFSINSGKSNNSLNSVSLVAIYTILR